VTVRVGIIMGSDSDLPVMERAADMLERSSALPTNSPWSAPTARPSGCSQYAREAAGRGLDVIIAGAGGAAHLPGMVAAISVLPVIGVPISATKLLGHDALLSIVQMPAGVPVATVAIDNATNAGILAAQMVSIADPALRLRLAAYKADLAARVQEKADRVSRQG
jgi:5-(carboxyamino)imidazole ribonucleotide mutase